MKYLDKLHLMCSEYMLIIWMIGPERSKSSQNTRCVHTDIKMHLCCWHSFPSTDPGSMQHLPTDITRLALLLTSVFCCRPRIQAANSLQMKNHSLTSSLQYMLAFWSALAQIWAYRFHHFRWLHKFCGHHKALLVGLIQWDRREERSHINDLIGAWDLVQKEKWSDKAFMTGMTQTWERKHLPMSILWLQVEWQPKS